MDLLALALIVASAVLAGVALIQSRATSLVAWAVLATDVALLVTFGAKAL